MLSIDRWLDICRPNNFIYQQNPSTNKWQNMKIYFYVFENELSMTSINYQRMLKTIDLLKIDILN